MALRDQPYLPLYVQDYLTDEKLNECSAEKQGIYIKIMCLLHKQNIYGSILLKQKHNKTPNNIENFAIQLDNHLPFTKDKIQEALTELIDENVMQLKGDILSQKRMVRDGEISLARSKAGKKGMDSRYNQDSFVITNTLTNDITNSENETEDEKSLKEKRLCNFEIFWQAYPKRKGKRLGKKQCEDWWTKNVTTTESADKIINACNEYAQSDQSRKSNGEFVRDPIRFLRADYWKDWTREEKPQQPKRKYSQWEDEPITR